MAPLLRGNRLRRDVIPVLLALLGLACGAGPLRAQGAASVFFTRELRFRIPFQMNAEAAGITSIYLYVSQDNGQKFLYVATARPQERSFVFEAPREGWYWFAVQTYSPPKGYSPATGQLQAQIKVCVDRTPPVIKLWAVQPPGGDNVAVEWDVRDENLNPADIILEYRPAGTATWYRAPGAPQLGPTGSHSWKSQSNGPWEVRMRARDRALNAAFETVTIRPGDYPPPPGGGDRGGWENNRNPGPAGGAAAETVHVKSRTFRIEGSPEEVGPSGVDSVNIWIWSQGRGWSVYREGAPKEGPYEIKVPQQGRYGITLIPVSGAGLSDTPPRGNDPPQVWVEVDETRPTISLTRPPVPGRGTEAGMLTVFWRADDKFLPREPITITYSETPNGEFKPIPNASASKLPNTGHFQFSTQGMPPKGFYVRVEAVDQAGNVNSVVSQKVIIDLQKPRFRIKADQVKPIVDGAPSPAQPTGSGGHNEGGWGGPPSPGG